MSKMATKINIYEIVGYIAGILCAVQNIPQIYKLYKTKSSNDISVIFLYIGILSGILWIIFSAHEKNIPVLLFGIFEVILLSIVLFLTYKYKNNNIESDIV